MKKLILLFLSIILFSHSNAQFKGRTQVGRIVPQKEIINEDKSPVITLLEPEFIEGKELTVNEKMITVRGVVKPADINKIMVNNINAVLLGSGEFYANYTLNFGKNILSIKVYDNSGNIIEKSIAVSWTPDLTGPVIKIIDPPVTRGIKAVSKSDVILLKGEAYDENGVSEVLVNDRKTVLKQSGDFTVNIFLQPGDNQLIIRAMDNKSNVTIDTFYVSRKLETIIAAGKYIALVIGINSYEGYWAPLNNAVNDAKAMSDILQNEYMFDTVITLMDKQATRNNIIHELELLTANVKSNDNVLIYYSGHGQYKKELNKGYWVPVDAKSNSIADFISNNEVKTFMGGIPSKHTLLISDACFAGDIFRGRSTESVSFNPNNLERYYREVYSKTSRVALTSGGLEEVMDAGKEGHSIFTYYLIKALKENNKKLLDSGQLFNDFRIAVANNSEQTPLLQVIRDTGDEGGQFIFVRRD